jgi:hypothetical protein
MSETKALDRTREERRQDTIATIRQKRTLTEVWAKATGDHPLLDNRAMAAAKFIALNSRVMDIGCAAMLIEKYLPLGCTYLPLDCVPRDERTTICDLNADPVPDLNADVAVVLGVLEYLFHVPKFLKQVHKVAPTLVLSYHPFDRDPGRDRLSMLWNNSLNSGELIALLRYAGYKKIKVERYARTLLFYLAE